MTRFGTGRVDSGSRRVYFAPGYPLALLNGDDCWSRFPYSACVLGGALTVVGGAGALASALTCVFAKSSLFMVQPNPAKLTPHSASVAMRANAFMVCDPRTNSFQLLTTVQDDVAKIGTFVVPLEIPSAPDDPPVLRHIPTGAWTETLNS
jgi:hypothetical protein